MGAGDLSECYLYLLPGAYLQMWHSYNHSPALPTFLVEGHYDLVDNWTDEYGTASVLRRQEYGAMLSGRKVNFTVNSFP